VKQPAQTLLPASGFVTVRSRAPGAALEAMVTLSVSWVAELRVVEFTVIPALENEAVAPSAKPVPDTVSVWLAADCPRLDGVGAATVGPTLTVKQPVQVKACESVFVTVTSRAPGVAPAATDTSTVACVVDTNDVECTVIPPPENENTKPRAKLEPVIVNVCDDAPCPRENGDTDDNTGSLPATWKQPHEPDPPSGFVTTTLQPPGATPSSANRAEIDDDEFTDTFVPTTSA
jgi:hypothetical protein